MHITDKEDGGEKGVKMQVESVESWKLPLEITSDILSRLPVKSVMRCRCVSKDWRSLLSNPHFINMHLTRSSKDPSLFCTTMKCENGPERMTTLGMVGSVEVNFDAYLIAHMLELRVDPVIVPLQDPVFKGSLFVWSSCNGLLLCSHMFDRENLTMSIFNPFTRETLELPRGSFPFKITIESRGLGYHTTTKEYKVLWFVDVPSPDHSYKLMAEVYTLGSTSWRSKGDVPFALLWNTESVSCNGALHWLVRCPISSRNVVISSFDIADEEFQLLPIPTQLSLGNCGTSTADIGIVEPPLIKLKELGGSLSLVDFSSGDCIDIWIMKYYGVGESWNKLFVVSIAEVVISVSWKWQFEGGEIILVYNDKRMVSYDPSNHQIRHLATQIPNGLLNSFVHVGSCVSPRLTV